jgi:hypothetical protein
MKFLLHLPEKFLKTYPNYDELIDMFQEELGKLCFEGFANHVMKMKRQRKQGLKP